MTRLVRAEILKLATRRGLAAAALCLTLGATIAAYGILELLHAANSAKHGPAGGTANFVNAMWLITQLGSIAVILVGATAGAGDIGSGFFRTLVVTGRSRFALFGARLPSGLSLVAVLVVVDYLLVAAAATALADGSPRPSTMLLLHTAEWMLLYMSVIYLVSVGAASLFGSRSTSIAVLVGLQLAVTPVLQGVHGLHAPREAVLGVAIWQLAPRILQSGAPTTDLHMTQTAALVVLACWVVAVLAAGCWRTVTRDA